MLPLKKDMHGQVLPVETEVRKVPPLDDVLLFFRFGFAPAERKFKVLLLVQLGARIRVHEACALNLADFVRDTNFRRFRVLIQKKKTNKIVEKELPESIAALLRSWISDNLEWIYSKEGCVFPHTNNRSLYTPPHSVQDWFCKKRKQLAAMFPKRSFGDIINPICYKNVNNSVIPKHQEEATHMWSSHLMKRMSGTLIQLIEKDPKFTQAMLCHENIHTTMKHYVDQATILENREARVINKIFDVTFYDSIKEENVTAPAVWDELKMRGK
jgi:integrase